MSIILIPQTGPNPPGNAGGTTRGNPTPTVTVKPFQITGFVPLKACTDTECRNSDVSCAYINPVFGAINVFSPTYENDFNTFVVNVDLVKSLANQQIQFILQRCGSDNKTWSDIVILSNTYGILQPLGSIIGHPTYTSFQINWGRVVLLQGPGVYRIKVQDNSITSVSTYQSYFEFPSLYFFFDSGITLYNNEGGSVFIPLHGQALNQQAVITLLNKQPFSINNKLTFSLQPPQSAGEQNQIQCQSGTGFGPSIRRIDFDGILLTTRGTGISTTNFSSISCFFVSEPFFVRAFNCEQADGTVKFEASLTGKIGDIKQDYLVYDLSGITLYDSIRVPGIFGYETIPKYLEVNLEYGQPSLGKIERVRDEAIQQFEFHGFPMPKYLHDRLGVYGLMADTLKVSDYNKVNSDWDIKQVGIVKSGAYEPQYYDDKSLRRFGKVKALFTRNPSAVIKSLC